MATLEYVTSGTTSMVAEKGVPEVTTQPVLSTVADASSNCTLTDLLAPDFVPLMDTVVTVPAVTLGVRVQTFIGEPVQLASNTVG